MPGRVAVILVAFITSLACSSGDSKQRHFANGERFLAGGEPAKAIIEFRNAVAADQMWGDARRLLAKAYEANGELDRALGEYVRAADLLPDNAEVQIKAAGLLLRVGHFEDAQTRAERIIAIDPKLVDGYILLGNALAGLRDFEGALAQIEEARRLEPDRSQIYSTLALIQVAHGQPDKARAAFEKAAETAPNAVAPLLAIANFEWSQGEGDAAERALKRALALEPQNVVVNRALANFYMDADRPAAAEAHLKSLATPDRADAQLMLADYYATYGRLEDARRILEPLAAQPKTASAAEARLAELRYSEGERVVAHQMIDKLLERDANFPEAQLLKARWLINEGKAEDALVRAKQALATNPELVPGLYIRGVAEVRTRRIPEAIKSFTEVLRLNPRATEAQVSLSSLHLSRLATDSAALYAEEALKNESGNLQARLALIRAWIAGGSLARAEAELAALDKRVPANAAILELQGSVQSLSGKEAAARRSFGRALEIDPAAVLPVVGLVKLDFARRDYQRAQQRVERQLAARGDDTSLLVLLARSYMAQGRGKPAEQALERAIRIDPLETAPFAMLARMYVQEAREDAVLTEYDDLARNNPRDVASRTIVAMVMHGQGKIGEAKRRYQEILAIEPRATVAANNLASIYADEGENLDVAQRLAEAASQQLPGDPDIHDTLGSVYYRLTLHGQAVSQFQQSVRLDPNNPLYHYHLGLAYSKNGQPNQARDAFRRALALNPKLLDAQRALNELGV